MSLPALQANPPKTQPWTPDPALSRRGRSGDCDPHNRCRLADFRELYPQYFPKVFAYVYGRVQDKDAAMDIVSDSFEKALCRIDSLRSPDRFGAWILAIASNATSGYWRREKRAAGRLREAACEWEFQRQPRAPEEAILREERLSSLLEFVRQLPRREQEIIALKFDAEFTNWEIADALNMSRGSVRVTLFRALRKLRERMQAGRDEGA